jgi:hypothetical protein
LKLWRGNIPVEDIKEVVLTCRLKRLVCTRFSVDLLLALLDNNAISRENVGIGPFVKGYPLFRAGQLDSFKDDEKIWSRSGWVQGSMW